MNKTEKKEQQKDIDIDTICILYRQSVCLCVCLCVSSFPKGGKGRTKTKRKCIAIVIGCTNPARLCARVLGVVNRFHQMQNKTKKIPKSYETNQINTVSGSWQNFAITNQILFYSHSQYKKTRNKFDIHLCTSSHTRVFRRERILQSITSIRKSNICCRLPVTARTHARTHTYCNTTAATTTTK